MNMAVKPWILFTLLALLFGIEFVMSGNPWEGMKIYCKVEQYNLLAEKPGCTPQRFRVAACLGLCTSYVQLTANLPYMITHCKCCRAKTTVKKSFTFSTCNPGVDRTIEIDSATECACQRTNCY